MKWQNNRAFCMILPELRMASLLVVSCVFLSFLLVAEPVNAQLLPEDDMIMQINQPEEGVIDPFLRMSLNDAMRTRRELKEPDIEPSRINSLFFTLWQHSLLQEAKQLFVTRPPDDHELDSADDAPRSRGIREISLGGIVYHAPERWTVWMNGKRMTPEAIPKEVIDIRVNENHIELKWFDAYNNLIYPIRLKPHQRFNLDSRIFLPGTGTL